jgi:hypothetical protein
VQFADGFTLSVQSASNKFPLVAANGGSGVNVQLRFATALAGSPLIVQPLDGGTVNDQNSTIGDDGTAGISFQLPTRPGLYRAQLTCGSTGTTLQFWIADPAQPDAGPPTL